MEQVSSDGESEAESETWGVRTPGMTEADVVDPESGVSVKRDGSTLGEIVLRGACVMLGNEYCRAKLPHYMVPKTVVFKEELPKINMEDSEETFERNLGTANIPEPDGF
ncbi:hypothetical protein V6N13_139274 [Hibiscus sabdariffa]|uniref:Uncharacterized protein n=1 Tax=Hibiscus sabdariffa TaxID=183260 RepID=A0ABR2C8K9_9ROSI